MQPKDDFESIEEDGERLEDNSSDNRKPDNKKHLADQDGLSEFEDDGWGWYFQIGIQVLIVYSVVIAALETMEDYDHLKTFFDWSEGVVVIIFTAEYIIRMRAHCPMWMYPLRPMAIIDLLAILPFYISLIVSTTLSLAPLRALRLLRIFRLLKLARYSSSLQMLGTAIKRTGPELLVFLFMAAIIVVISAMGLYYAEHDKQPDVYSSIPDSIWWAIVTLTTVGYGDVYPTTGIGRVIASIVMLTGIGFIAVPTSLISSAMTEIAIESRAERAAKAKRRKEARRRRKKKSKERKAKLGNPAADAPTRNKERGRPGP